MSDRELHLGKINSDTWVFLDRIPEVCIERFKAGPFPGFIFIGSMKEAQEL